ncbi:ABC transporter permease [bacterium]|nr:ABC transporter permease [bacterium]
MSKKIFAVIRREFITRAKTKGFIIGTLAFPIIMVLMFSAMFVFGKLFQPTTKKFVIIDQPNLVYEKFTALQSDTLSNGKLQYIFEKHSVVEDELEASLELLQNKVRNKEIDGYMLIPETILETREIIFSARNVSDFEEQQRFARSFTEIIRNYRLEQVGMSAEIIQRERELGRVWLKSKQVTDKGEVEKSGVSSYLLSYILTYVMLLMIMIYGQMTMRSVIEEKSQRISETIVSSIKPLELMLGKIIGICGLGLTQLGIFGGFMYLVSTYAVPILQRFGIDSPDVFEIFGQLNFSASMFGFMLTFFILGFVFFAGLFAALGAMVNSEDEGQQLQMPLIFLLMIGYFMMISIAKNPDTARALWFSLIPFWTPLIMFARIAASDPILPSGTWLSIGTMTVSTVVLIAFIAKIYRVGILMYGKKASFKEVLRWLRYK